MRRFFQAATSSAPRFRSRSAHLLGDLSLGAMTVAGIVGDAVYSRSSASAHYDHAAKRDGRSCNRLLNVRSSSGSPALLAAASPPRCWCQSYSGSPSTRSPAVNAARAGSPRRDAVGIFRRWHCYWRHSGCAASPRTPWPVAALKSASGWRSGARPRASRLVLRRVSVLVGAGVLVGAAVSLWASASSRRCSMASNLAIGHARRRRRHARGRWPDRRLAARACARRGSIRLT